MDRAIIRNVDLSWTLIEDDRRLDLPAEATDEEVSVAAAGFFTPEPEGEA